MLLLSCVSTPQGKTIVPFWVATSLRVKSNVAFDLTRITIKL